MNNLYQQLIYNWERGFYSVVKDEDGFYSIFSTKDQHGFLKGTWSYAKRSEAKDCLGEREFGSKADFDTECRKNNWKIIDTIHPSELMGKGFQVGDKVNHQEYRIGKIIKVDPDDKEGLRYYVQFEEDCYWCNLDSLKPVLPVEEKKEVDQLGNKLKQPIELDDNLVENSVNVDFDSGKPTARVGFLNGKYISIGERDVESRSHICNCGFWDSEKKWGETVYTQQFGDRCVSMSVTNNYVICSKCGQKLRRVAISYLDD